MLVKMPAKPPTGSGPGVSRRAFVFGAGLLCGSTAMAVDEPRTVESTARTAGLMLRLLAPAQWPIGAEPAGATIEVELHNLARHSVRFALLDTLRFGLADAGGRELPLHQGRDALSRAAPFSPPVAPGDLWRVRRVARLHGEPHARRLQIDDGFGGLWASGLLAPGPYTLRCSMSHAMPAGAAAPAGEVPVWIGSLSGAAVPIEL